jgi:hypothetical protein
MTQLRTVLKYVAALGLWLATIGLAIADIYFVREIFFAIYAQFSTEPQPAQFLGNFIVLLSAIAALGFIVASTEYHRKHFCKHESWDMLTRTLAVELAIPFIATVLL